MIFEKLSNEEKQMIEDYIADYANVDGDWVGVQQPLQHILRFWEVAKEDYLYTLLNQNLIIRKDIEFKKSKYELEQNLRPLWENDNAAYTFITAYKTWIRQKYPCPDWSEDPASPYRVSGKLFDLIERDNLATNIYNGETFVIMDNENEPFKINNGCKISRTLGKIAEMFNLPGFEEFRIAHSQVLNQKMLKGTLCASIHPLDFMTASDNDCGWTSCMNWREGGEYHRGTVEMMNSTSVVEVYLASDTPMRMAHGRQWSNKKWREFFVVTPTFIAGIKGYPYWNRDLEATSLAWLRELATNMHWGPYTESLFEFKPGQNCYCAELDKSFNLQFDTNAMYNDFYDTHYAYLTADCNPHLDYYYSGESECMCCGRTDSEVSFDSERMTLCCDCAETYYCYECGERISSDEMYSVDGNYYCQNCYDDLPYCAVCNEPHASGNIAEVHLAIDDNHILRHTCVSLCEYCFNHPAFLNNDAHIWQRQRAHGWWRETTLYVKVDDLDLKYIREIYDTTGGNEVFDLTSLVELEDKDTIYANIKKIYDDDSVDTELLKDFLWKCWNRRNADNNYHNYEASFYEADSFSDDEIEIASFFY